MQTEVVHVNPADPEKGPIARAAAVLRAGGLVAFPTETVYGLGANALDAAACAGIFTAKGRPADNPLIVHVADVEQARQVVASWPESADRLARRFWPGPLTLVLPRQPLVPDVVTAGGPTVAVRVPGHPVALAILRQAGIPVAAPSANRSGFLSPTRAEHVWAGLAGRIPLILDGGATPGGLESTVLDLSQTPPRLLRPGLIGRAKIEALIGPIQQLAPEAENRRQPLASPGMLSRHYAPRAPLECRRQDSHARLDELTAQGSRVGWLTFDSAASELRRPGVITIVMPTDPARYASRLYAELHALDAAGVDRIVVELPPDAEEWLAVHDRLRRASG